jgi:hypothetical protein
VSVQRSQASIQRGQNAAYAVTVSTENGPASKVTVTLTAQPASQQPVFTSGCAKGNTTAACTLSTVSDQQPVDLHAQIPVAASANSVSSVKLTATAAVVTTAKWAPPSAAVTVAVTAAPSASASPAKSSASAPPETALPLGPIPELNGVSSSLISSSLIGAGNAAGLFPAISPSDTPGPSPSPGVLPPDGKQNAAPVADSSPVFTAQVAGLIALGVAIFLTVTRLSLRRRFRSGKPNS